MRRQNIRRTEWGLHIRNNIIELWRWHRLKKRKRALMRFGYHCLLKLQCFRPLVVNEAHCKNNINNFRSITPSTSQGSRLQINGRILQINGPILWLFFLPTPKDSATVVFLGQSGYLLPWHILLSSKIEHLYYQLTIITRKTILKFYQSFAAPLIISTCFHADMYRKIFSYKTSVFVNLIV